MSFARALGPDGQFVANIVHFARILRASGLPVGTGKIVSAVQAVRAAGVSDRDDFYWTLHAVFVNHPNQRLIFDQAFGVFWRNPRMLERAMSALLPEIRVPRDLDKSQEIAKRLSDSLDLGRASERGRHQAEPETELRAALTYSDREMLQTADFESMTRAEMEQAKKAIAAMRVAFREIPTRRFRSFMQGDALDMRQTLRRSVRSMGDTIALMTKRKATKPPPVIVLCDISGSMSEYSRVMLHFSHLLMQSRSQVFSFTFGTRLTNITRQLRVRDVDCALDEVAELVSDWHGGTRIGECLREFNQRWIRRLPVHSAVVLLVSDGLDRSDSGDLGHHIEILHRSCRQLIWLNPLLRYRQFEPKAGGIRAMLPHVDEFRPVHNLQSIEGLVASLTERRDGRGLDAQRRRWREKLHAAAQGADAEPART